MCRKKFPLFVSLQREEEREYFDFDKPHSYPLETDRDVYPVQSVRLPAPKLFYFSFYLPLFGMKQYKPSLQPASHLIDASPRGCRQTSIAQLLDKETPLASFPHAWDRGEVPALLCRPASSGPASVMQRAVGFEFETGWLVEQREIDESGKEKSTPFKKKDVITTATPGGFRMEADEAEEGQSEIEFVVRPPVEESSAGYVNLQTIMDAMRDTTNALCEKKSAPFYLQTVTGAEADKQTYVTPRGENMQAGPQATTGIRLDKVPEFMELFHKKSPTGENIHPDSKAFVGLATLVGEYVRRAQPEKNQQGTFAYPKMMAEPLLSRTDFAGLFTLIEPELQTYYLENKALWVRDVLKAAGLAPDMAQKDMLGRGVVEEKDLEIFLDVKGKIILHKEKMPDKHQFDEELCRIQEEYTECKKEAGNKPNRKATQRLSKIETAYENVLSEKLKWVEAYYRWLEELKKLESRQNGCIQHAGFTVQQWLESLLEGIDRLTTLKDAESMGEFGKKTENVGEKKDAPAGIFEWRGDQTKKIPAEAWKTYALDFMKKILCLHGHAAFQPVAPGPVESKETSGEGKEEKKE